MAPQPPKVLFVLTSRSQLGDTDKPTGWYLPEFAHPYAVLETQTEITVASPAGGEAPLDPNSVEQFKGDEASVKFLQHKQDAWKNTEKLSSFLGRASEYEALVVVGGHGPMWDLVDNKDSIALIKEFWDAGKIVSAVCHGPVAFLNVKLDDGSYLIQNQPVTAFSNSEEDSAQMSQYMPFLLEDALKERGAKYEKAPEPWGAHVAVAKDGRLITGQNPASAAGLGEKVQEAIFGDLKA